ncbi:CaiB/BaiF CoA transferase family protein [Aquipuribacter nitratireducens]|uniref:CaiB/BaiF CoA transferase family protein n=1 Tax=Aquipuribacter nitratireducens TaxID=650104 RepID=A0ABW0GMM7_9MICO
MNEGPLAGLLVVDLGRALAAPHAAMMLGDLGARVVKVESPQGDDTRRWGPPFVGPAGQEESTYFLSCNRNKESVVLDLRLEADLGVLRALLVEADVLVENFRPGVLERLGLGLEVLRALNPRLVVLSITGFGHDGPDGGRAGYDQIAQGEAGLMSLTGAAPGEEQRVGVPVGDLLAGMNGAVGVLAALHERERTGTGQVVRTSLLASVVAAHSFQGTRWTVAGEVPRARGNHHPSIAPYGLFRAGDGAVQVACGSEALWRALCSALGLDPGAEGLATNDERVRNRNLLVARLEASFAERDVGEVLELLSRAGVPCGVVRTLDEVYEWEQTRSQGLVVTVDHETLGPTSLPGPPLRLFGHDGRERTPGAHRPPPTLGRHDESVREWLSSRVGR